MYERLHPSRFRKSDCFRPPFRLGYWFVIACACALALQSCRVLHHAVLRYEVDPGTCPYYDTRIVIDLYPNVHDTLYFVTRPRY